jgi:hypothetical protein
MELLRPGGRRVSARCGLRVRHHMQQRVRSACAQLLSPPELPKPIWLLLAEKEKHLRIAAGILNAATVDLSLVKLPADALMFPGWPGEGEAFSFSRPRDPDAIYERI